MYLAAAYLLVATVLTATAVYLLHRYYQAWPTHDQS